MSERVFNIEISGSCSMKVSSIWPDGDAPENPTAEDVIKAMENFGNPYDVLAEWSLDDWQQGRRRIS